ncbi:MAG: hypothetical protein GY771_06585 [bacterium]|nr:hypothetical protein [bacterium]
MCITDIIHMGGIGTLFSVILGVILILLLFVGYILAFAVGRKDPNGLPMKIWGHLTLGTGFSIALIGFIGTFWGLHNIWAYLGTVPPMEASGIMAQGLFEVSFNFLFGFFFALLALFGFLSVKLLTHK